MAGATTYTVEYFSIDGLAWVIRALLTLAGEEYKNEFPDWPVYKEKTPFGRLPVLKETSADGSEFVLAERCAIELYLAEKYGFLPRDSKQKAVALQYYFQLVDVFDTLVMYIFHITTDVSKDRYLDRLRTFIQRHEPILAQSKSGYYCGDSLTLPDICLYFLYKSVFAAEDQSLNWFVTEQTPAIAKLVSMIEENTNIKKAFL
ncbi:hypothetical protein BB560_003311 [Smittium megazygosporum]|uniref:Glutathione transferase n=1 Tax=Smittium megazygosporum TaxID=133381 RepID=A0A2T9ZCG8_9FUNG|nr:hypothetical protein BB560_003311 [Smittium megazygosporum]